MDVVGVGALNYDRLYKVPRVARLGEEVFVSHRFKGGGGSAANTVVGLARLGIRTGFIGVVGKDLEGDLLLEELRKEGVDLNGISRINIETGEIIGLVDDEGERVLYAFPGANNHLVIDDSKVAYAEKASYLHLSSFVGDIAFGSQKSLLDRVKSMVTFSPGMLYVGKGLDELKDVIKRCYVIFLNREELQLLTGEELKKGADILLEVGVKIVAVTLGRDGCYIFSSETEEKIPGYPAKAIDTTGAGDAFAAGFIYGLIKGFNIKSCGKLGNKLASLCVEAYGARTGLPKEGEIQEFISSLI